jgi:hypothetical protein
LTHKPWGTEDDNIKIELREIGCENVDLTQLAQDGLRRDAFMNLALKLGSINEEIYGCAEYFSLIMALYHGVSLILM